MGEMEAFGIAVDLPAGCDGAIYRRSHGAADAALRGAGGAPSTEGTANPVAHLATFPLPAVRGDYGSGAVERMRAEDVLVCILEFDPEAGRTPLFATTGVPRFRPGDFSPNAMQRTIGGMSGAQAFFNIAGRAFCAYVVLGSHRSRGLLTPVANRLLESVRIEDLGPSR